MRWLALLALLGLGCEAAQVGYKCYRDDECALNGTGGRCIYPAQVCALPSTTCPSGYVYHSSAGGNAGKCVPANLLVDMGTATPDDMSMSSSLDQGPGVPPDMATAPIDMAMTPKTLAWATQASGLSSTTNIRGGFAFGNSAWAVGDYYIVSKLNGAAAWSPEVTGAADFSEQYSGVWAASAMELWIAGYQLTPTPTKGILYHSTNGGGIWTVQQPSKNVTGQLRGIAGSGAADVFSVGDNGAVVHNNATNTWDNKTATAGSGFSNLAVFAAGGNTVYVAGPKVFKSIDGGTNWSPVLNPPGSSSFSGIWGSSASDVWAVGSGFAYHTTNGTDWSPVDNVSSVGFYGVYGTGVDDVVFVGAAGVILHFYDGIMHREASAVTSDLFAVFAGGPKDYYAVGAKGVIVHGQ